MMKKMPGTFFGPSPALGGLKNYLALKGQKHIHVLLYGFLLLKEFDNKELFSFQSTVIYSFASDLEVKIAQCNL